MQTPGLVEGDFVVEAIRTPFVVEEWHRDCLTEVVQLQATAGDRVHNGRVMDYLDFDTTLQRP